MYAHTPSAQTRQALLGDRPRHRPATPDQPNRVFAGLMLALPLGAACWAALVWQALRLLG